MKILYFTKSKQYTLKALNEMAELGHELTVVFKSPQTCHGTEMKDYCDSQNIHCVCNDDLYKDDFFGRSKYDLGISNTYGRLIKREVITALNGRIFNIHCAPLPMYKGLYAYNWGIYNGEQSWSVTAHYVNEKFDEGDVIRATQFPIDPQSIGVKELEEESQKHGYQLTMELLKEFENGAMPKGKKQGKNGHYYSSEDFENLKRINVNYSMEEAERRIRACYCPGYEGAYLYKEGKKLHLEILENIK